MVRKGLRAFLRTKTRCLEENEEKHENFSVQKYAEKVVTQTDRTDDTTTRLCDFMWATADVPVDMEENDSMEIAHDNCFNVKVV